MKAQDENGDLALHHAISRNLPGTVQLLLDHSSDPYVKNKAGDDAFQTASLNGRELILDELLFEFKPQLQRWIESYQLLGGYYIDFGDDTDKGIQCWKDAIDVQQRSSCVEIISSNPKPGLPIRPGSEHVGRVGGTRSEPRISSHVCADDP